MDYQASPSVQRRGALKSITAASGGCDDHDSTNAITFNDNPLHEWETKPHGGAPKPHEGETQSKWELPANPCTTDFANCGGGDTLFILPANAQQAILTELLAYDWSDNGELHDLGLTSVHGEPLLGVLTPRHIPLIMLINCHVRNLLATTK